MAPRNRSHLVIPTEAIVEAYTSHGEGRGPVRPPSPADRYQHGQGLRGSFESVVHEGFERRAVSAAEMNLQPSSQGVYVTFDSYPGFALALTSLDPQVGADRPELVAVSTTEGPLPVEQATVFVPDGAIGYFVQRFERYATEDTPKGKPRFQDFVERIASLRLATLRLLWTDDAQLFPEEDAPFWWEVWLRRTDGGEIDRVRAFAEAVGASVSDRRLIFDRRVITIVHATRTQLGRAVDLLDDLAELRRSKTPTPFLVALPGIEQAQWVDDLLGRTTFAGADSPAVCLLDTGVTRSHPLLEASLAATDVHTCEPAWGTHDHLGHGTEMAGATSLTRLIVRAQLS